MEKVTTIKKYDTSGKPKEERIKKVTTRKITTFQNGQDQIKVENADLTRETCPALDFSGSNESNSSELTQSLTRLTRIKEDSREQDPETDRLIEDDLKGENNLQNILQNLEKISLKSEKVISPEPKKEPNPESIPKSVGILESSSKKTNDSIFEMKNLSGRNSLSKFGS